MNIGTIIHPNEKGQIVIPLKIRQVLMMQVRTPLNIRIHGRGVYLYPITHVVTSADKESSYLSLLEKTKGAWAGDTWDETNKKREDIEMQQSQERDKLW